MKILWLISTAATTQHNNPLKKESNPIGSDGRGGRMMAAQALEIGWTH